jgi:hypothetical protein
MKEYDIVAVLWDDHIAFERSPLIKKASKIITPTLTVGFLFKETKHSLIIVSNLEKYKDRDEANFIVVLKGGVRGIKRYGKIKLRKIRCRED